MKKQVMNTIGEEVMETDGAYQANRDHIDDTKVIRRASQQGLSQTECIGQDDYGFSHL